MPTVQEQFDIAMHAFSQGRYLESVAGLQAVLAAAPEYFEARLALGMAYCRQADYAAAIAEGHRAEKLRPDEPLVHTNLSLFYMKAGDKEAAERHGLRSRLASWKGNLAPPGQGSATDEGLQSAPPKRAPVKLPPKFPDMPWKKKPPIGGGSTGGQ